MPSLLIPIESAEGETRVAATPETVKKFVSLGFTVSIESSAGLKAGFLDEQYISAGGFLVQKNENDSWANADLILCVQPPKESNLTQLKPKSIIVGLLAPYENQDLIKIFKTGNISALALECLPRISRAQSADALSSQANVAGYKSVLLAAAELDRYFPMLMTAAGTVQPAKVVVLGAGVAGLQAVATARRLGAVVFVSDIRDAVKEQVESLGARFISPPKTDEIPSESGGYAKQVSDNFLTVQRQKLSDHLSEADVAICTAQVPGKKAPRLIDEDMLNRMRPGSVVVDLAVQQGGNCVGTRKGQTIDRKGVKLIGASDLPCSVANHSSSLYARNLLALVQLLVKDQNIFLDIEDELINGCLITNEGECLHSELSNSGGSK